MKTRWLRRRISPVGSALIALAALQAQAQDQHYDHERASIYLGLFVTDRATETRLDSDSGLGTDVDWENDLGLEGSMSVARIGGNVWFKPRQRFDFSMFDLSRTASAVIDEEIEFGDEIFVINTVIESTFDLTIAKADYTFTPLSRPKGYLGLTGGLYIASTKVELRESSGAAAESESLTAPLPVIGLRGEYRITDRITLNGAAQWFGINVEDVSGRLTDLFIGADYRIGSRWDLGAGYNDVGMSIEAEDNGFSGRIDWGYDGWLVYFRANFGGE